MILDLLASRASLRQMGLGLVALAAGLLVYATGRPFGRFTGPLPTFAHAIAFSLLTAAVLDCGPWGRRRAFRICLAWVATEAAFEAGQHRWLSAQIAAIVPGSPDAAGVLGHVQRYFLAGRFDWLDLAAAIAGGAGAFVLIVNSTGPEA